MALRSVVLIVVCLIVGLIVGFGAGAMTIQPATTTSFVTQTVSMTMTRTETSTTRLTETQTVREPTTIREVKEVTVTVTLTKTVTAVTYAAQCKMGEECGEKGIVIIVHGMERRDSIGIYRPEEGNNYLILDITIKNQLGDEYSYSQLFMTMKDENDRVYSTSVAAVELTGYLPGGGTLKPGESVRGYICFEVPKTSQSFTFRYSDLTRIITITLSK